VNVGHALVAPAMVVWMAPLMKIGWALIAFIYKPSDIQRETS